MAGLALLLLGIVFLALWRVVGHSEKQPWVSGASAPSTVHVTTGKDYQLAVRGGVPTLAAHGIVSRPDRFGGTVPALACQWSDGVDESEPLSLTAESVGTNAVNDIATFAGPVTGDIRITCSRLSAVFVPDADGRPGDEAGWFLLLSVITLSAGGMLGMSALYAASSARRTAEPVPA